MLLAGRRTVAGATSAESVRLGETPVRLLVEDHPPAGVTYVHLHENETTAAQAAARVVARSGGRLVRVQSQRTRLITFLADSVGYTFDPNRVFTQLGIERTLRRYGPDSPTARRHVAAFAERVLASVTAPNPTIVIAPHNNADAGYSIRTYAAGGALARDAADVHLNAARDPDDFCLVTDRALFDALKGHGLNVVLQHAGQVDDDGSLAVYCQRHGLRYANVEAQYGHLREQVEALDVVRRLGG